MHPRGAFPASEHVALLLPADRRVEGQTIAEAATGGTPPFTTPGLLRVDPQRHSRRKLHVYRMAFTSPCNNRIGLTGVVSMRRRRRWRLDDTTGRRLQNESVNRGNLRRFNEGRQSSGCDEIGSQSLAQTRQRHAVLQRRQQQQHNRSGADHRRVRRGRSRPLRSKRSGMVNHGRRRRCGQQAYCRRHALCRCLLGYRTAFDPTGRRWRRRHPRCSVGNDDTGCRSHDFRGWRHRGPARYAGRRTGNVQLHRRLCGIRWNHHTRHVDVYARSAARRGRCFEFRHCSVGGVLQP